MKSENDRLHRPRNIVLTRETMFKHNNNNTIRSIELTLVFFFFNDIIIFIFSLLSGKDAEKSALKAGENIYKYT